MNRITAAFRRAFVVLALPVVLVGGWWVLTAGSTSFYWPPLHAIADIFGPTWLHGRVSSDIVPSIMRLLAGYLAALVTGVATGTLIGSQRTVRAVLEPVLEFFRAIPPPAVIPVLMLIAGIGDGMKVLVIMFGCVWPILLNTAAGVQAIDPMLRDTARSYRLRPWSRIVHLVLPGAGPQIATGARQALSVGLILMVISEMFAASNGVGFTIIEFERQFEIPEMWTGIILLGLIGVLLAMVFHVVESRVLSWYHGARAAEQKR